MINCQYKLQLEFADMNGDGLPDRIEYKKFNKDQKSQWDSFDRFFDDDFFNRERDPFEALEKFHKRMDKMMGKSLNDSFSQSWDSWLQDRFSVGSDQIP